jgi:ankyrin repeat protein
MNSEFVTNRDTEVSRMTNLLCALTAVTLTTASFVMASPIGDDRLVDAMKDHDREAVQVLLRQHADVNSPAADGATPLHWAAYWDDQEAASWLINAGARVDASNENGVTPLSLACSNSSDAMVALLLKAGANANAATSNGETVLMTCSRTGSVKAVQALLDTGADSNAKESSREQTALMWAVAEGHHAVVDALIASGANVNAHSLKNIVERRRSGVSVAPTPVEISSAGTGGFTPLLFAARAGSVELISTLLMRGADVNQAAGDGSTPLIVATLRGHVPAAQFLLDYGADPDGQGPGYTALHWAAGSWETQLTGPFGIERNRDAEWDAMSGLGARRAEFVRALLEHGANPNVRLAKEPPRFGYANLRFHVSLAGATPFLLAARVGDVEIMKLLAMWGADTTLGTNLHTTPLMVAAGIGRVPNESFTTESQTLAAVRLALELGGDLNALDDIGDTALHGAAHIRSDALIRWLVGKGANINVKNKRGLTPLMIAQGAGNSDSPGLGADSTTAALLRKLGAQ